MANPGANKTEKPTAKKRNESRKKGMAARSSELPQAISLVVAAVLLPVLMPRLFERMGAIFTASISPEGITDPSVATAMFAKMSWEALRVFIPLVVFTTVASLIAQLALTGGKPNFHKLKPKWSNVNPIKGMKRFVSVQLLWDFLRTVSKLGLLIGLTWGMYGRTRDELLGRARPLSTSLGGIGLMIRDLMVRAAVAALLVGILDAAFNKYRFTKQLRMTKQEVKDEQKQQESNPLVKGEIRRRQIQLSRNRMIANVGRADV
ncbi:MAG: flagellar biosynthesis protein FlhB, partial [Acidimicrobiales bacterium]